MPDLIISVLTEFDLSSPLYLAPMGAPNPRLSGNGVQERNLIWRTVLANPNKEPYVASGSLVASVGGRAPVSWKRDVTIPGGTAIVIQGSAPGVAGGIGVLDTLGLPDGPADLDVAYKVDDMEIARVICPVVINGQDLTAGGVEHPAVVIVDTDGAAKAELAAKKGRVEFNTKRIADAQAENAGFAPRIAKLEALLK